MANKEMTQNTGFVQQQKILIAILMDIGNVEIFLSEVLHWIDDDVKLVESEDLDDQDDNYSKEEIKFLETETTYTKRSSKALTFVYSGQKKMKYHDAAETEGNRFSKY
ncbi:hypothetical protein FQA39_LY00870 [Lamprigera yunnana]|nr:hypothetical protein FQA39_LY00870 [Lamprigera yunnana]